MRGRSAAIPVRSTLRIFLSIDIVGSTRFKQTRRDVDSETIEDLWVIPFLAFFRNSVDDMAAQWHTMAATVGGLDKNARHYALGKPPAFWKGAGDEVLFTKVVRSPQDALLAVNALIAVMDKHKAWFAKSARTSQLSVKGTAWLAGFPINNAEVVIGRNPMADTRDVDPIVRNFELLAKRGDDLTATDYIGPSIDLGFRLRDRATPAQLVLSVDLAWLLARAEQMVSEDHRDRCKALCLPKWGYDGRHGLRGIMNDEPYPLVWLQMRDAAVTSLEADLRGLVKTSRVLAFCEEFLDGSMEVRTCPYIDRYKHDALRRVPEKHRRRLQALKAHIKRVRAASVPEVETGAGDIPAATTQFQEQIVKGFSASRAPAERASRKKRIP